MKEHSKFLFMCVLVNVSITCVYVYVVNLINECNIKIKNVQSDFREDSVPLYAMNAIYVGTMYYGVCTTLRYVSLANTYSE